MSILVKRGDKIAVVTLSRPEKLNALSRETITALSQAFESFASDETLRAVILTGAGDRAFSAGTDLSELIDVPAGQARAVADRGQQLCDQIEQTHVPVIAAINGIAAGGGTETRRTRATASSEFSAHTNRSTFRVSRTTCWRCVLQEPPRTRMRSRLFLPAG